MAQTSWANHLWLCDQTAVWSGIHPFPQEYSDTTGGIFTDVLEECWGNVVIINIAI